MDYIRNSKNRKLKTQILNFLSRLSFGTYRLGLAGKTIILCNWLFLVSLFFPWIVFRSPTGWESIQHWAFSLYSGGIGYGILVALLSISFFLLSHEKKEFLRAYVPFRLSDAQAIVFIDAMLLTACFQVVITSMAYANISTQAVEAGFGLKLGITGAFILLLASYFFSQNEKTRAVTMSYLDKKEDDYLGEYRDILGESRAHSHGSEKDKNMTLPI